MGHGPHVHVSGIEEVVRVAVEVGEAPPVEHCGVGLAEGVHELDLRFGEPRVGRRLRGWEEVGRVTTHLVEVGHDLRTVLHEDPHLPPGLHLTLDEQVPVQVEEVVVPPPPGPRLVPLRRHRVRVRPSGGRLLVGSHVTGPTVGVLHGIDEDQALPEDQFHVRVALGGQEVVRLGHGGATRADLVSVDSVEDHGHHRQPGQEGVGLGGGEATGIVEEAQVLLDGVEPGNALRRADDHDHQGTALPALGVPDEPGPVRRGSVERLEVADHVRRRRDGVPEAVADHLLQGGDVRIVPGSR